MKNNPDNCTAIFISHEIRLKYRDTSTSRNPLEKPWLLSESEFTRRASKAKLISPNVSPNVYHEARDETAALTESIAQVEAEIDERVKGLYGL